MSRGPNSYIATALVLVASSGACGDNAQGPVFFDDEFGTWQYLKSPRTNGVSFGGAVDVSADTVVTRDFGEDDADDMVHVFGRGTDGAWEHEQSLSESDLPLPSTLISYVSRFGDLVAIDEDVLAVSASSLDPVDVAYVFVYERRAGDWQFSASLPTIGRVDSLDVEDGVVVYGMSQIAAGRPAGGFEFRGPGAVFVASKVFDEWKVNNIEASDGTVGDAFGFSVALHGQTLLVGALLASASRGATYTFRQDGTSWDEGARVEAPEFIDGYWSWGLAIYDDWAVIGHYGDGIDVLSVSGTALTYASSLNKQTAEISIGGVRLALSESFLAACGDQTGVVHLFEREDGEFTVPPSSLLPFNRDPADPDGSDFSFGYSIALRDDRVVIGAPGERGRPGHPFEQGKQRSGAVYILAPR